MKPLRLYTCVYGEKHLTWMRQGLLPSLAWPGNSAAIEGCTWSFLTKGIHTQEIEEMVKGFPSLHIKDFEFLTLGPEFETNPHAQGMFLKEGFMAEISRSLTFNAQTLIAPPDTIFGEGSIANLKEIGKQRDSVVTVAHVRVLPELLTFIKTEKPVSNAKLVGLAFRHLHKTWEQAQVGLKQANSYVGGVSWRWLAENLYAVTHRLPTPYLMNFVPEDLTYFKNQIHFGELDHGWPSANLIHNQRQRLVGSSDAAFMVELTDALNNIPPVSFVRDESPDDFWRDREARPHNAVNRMTSVILRGE